MSMGLMRYNVATALQAVAAKSLPLPKLVPVPEGVIASVSWVIEGVDIREASPGRVTVIIHLWVAHSRSSRHHARSRRVATYLSMQPITASVNATCGVFADALSSVMQRWSG
jgi:hypothetical protein